MDALVFAANIMYVVTYFTDSMLRLRLLSVSAASCLATYFYCQPQPMLTVVCWNLFFIVLNLLQIVRMLLMRRHSAPTPPLTAEAEA
jgi:hypothetical protein